MSQAFGEIAESLNPAERLYRDLLEGTETRGIDIDALFHSPARGGWCVLEFLRCESVRPWESSPNRYWDRVRGKITALYRIAERLEGRLYWITWEDSREQFSILRVSEVAPDYVRYDRRDRDWEGFRRWYLALNADGAERAPARVFSPYATPGDPRRFGARA